MTGDKMKKYVNPFESRYASQEMLFIFSPQFKYSTWRKLWFVLAESQKELGLSISQEQIDSLFKHIDHIDFEKVSFYEKKFKHEVMAHLHAFGDVAGKEAKKILHLGATSAYLMDNTDLIQIKESLKLIQKKLLQIIKVLRNFCLKYKQTPIVGYTHFQQAQLTTLGKRASLWLQSFFFDYQELKQVKNTLSFRGVKGAVGTQDSFKTLFKNNWEKVKELDLRVAKKMGFDNTFSLTSQTYDRKLDFRILSFISSLAQSAHKMTNDIRLMQHLKEVEEDFSQDQIGSSAMAYKRNPILCERVSSLSKFVMSLPTSAAMISSTQWLERTLDDSACRRITLPQSFMGADAILSLSNDIVSSLRVNENIIDAHVEEAMPFVVTEELLMRATQKGFDRQEVHEKIRQISMNLESYSDKDTKPSLKDYLLRYGFYEFDENLLKDISNSQNHVGFSSEQVENFISEEIDDLLKANGY